MMKESLAMNQKNVSKYQMQSPGAFRRLEVFHLYDRIYFLLFGCPVLLAWTLFIIGQF